VFWRAAFALLLLRINVELDHGDRNSTREIVGFSGGNWRAAPLLARVISDASWVKMAREGKNHSILGFVKKL